MRKKLLALMMVAILALSLAACGGGGSSESADTGDSDAFAGGQTFSIKIGHSDTTTNLLHISLQNFEKYVEEQSGGAVQIDLYAAEQLGSNAEMTEMVEMGSLDAMMMPQGQEAILAPKLNTLGLPFLFPDYESVYKVLDSEIGDELVTEDLASHNMIQLAYWENGLRQTTNSKRPINSSADFAGLKIRTPEDAMTMAIFNALGASPSPLAFSELYLALQQGTFDGQENPVSNIYANNFQDVQKYLAMTNHKYECKNMIFSLTSWNKYPEDVQNLLLEAAKKFGDEHRQAIVDSQDQMLQELQDAGMEVTYPDIAELQAATESVYTDFYAENEWAEELVNRIKEKMGA
ncbi:MAG: TRAP transporter substrate-binding protein [Mogibacterium sp.]|nr:TRAP transporter substrate-binding protein [Mogibacterium sp.]MBR2539906.1 TRAP transporter substrate-binding protein [Mogibacterium sp.]